MKKMLIALGALTTLSLGSHTAMAAGDAGDAAKGAKVFNKCKACHTVQAGKNKSGPSLLGVIGRTAGTAEGFKRYKGLKGANWSWDGASLDEFLQDPRKYIKTRTKKTSSMALKLKKHSDRDDVIAYLKSLK